MLSELTYNLLLKFNEAIIQDKIDSLPQAKYHSPQSQTDERRIPIVLPIYQSKNSQYMTKEILSVRKHQIFFDKPRCLRTHLTSLIQPLKVKSKSLLTSSKRSRTS